MNNNIIDIIQRFQTHHALQEEREIQNAQVSTKGAVPPANKNESSKNTIFETEEVRVSTVAVPGSTEWSPPHDGRDRLVVLLGGMVQRYRGTTVWLFLRDGPGCPQTAISKCLTRQIRQGT
jgi:hypothetical protein